MITTTIIPGGARYTIVRPRSRREQEALGGDNIKPDPTLWTSAQKSKQGQMGYLDEPKVKRGPRRHYVRTARPDLSDFE